jgi:hypothetical protein
VATRFHFGSIKAASAPSPTTNAGAEWEHDTPLSRGEMAVAPSLSSLTNLSTTPDAADHLVNGDAMFMQYVSTEALAAQTIAAQTVEMQWQMLEANAANNLFMTWKLFVCGSTGTIKETLVAIQRDPANELATVSATNRRDTATTTVATVEAGDHIVLELGAGGTPTGAGGVQGHNFSVRIGNGGAGGDLPENDTETGTTFNPWLEFPNDLTFEAAAAAPSLKRKMPYPHQLEVPKFHVVQ